jgi:hypothetical protein
VNERAASNGKEFAAHKAITAELKAQVCFAHPKTHASCLCHQDQPIFAFLSIPAYPSGRLMTIAISSLKGVSS